MKYMNSCMIFIIFFISQNIFSQEFPKIMYVTSKEGLNKRENPSITSKKLGVLLYGERIIVYEKSYNQITIDGITNYWYKTRGATIYDNMINRWVDYDNSWVFGGYLSEELPADAPVVMGLWDDENDSWQIYKFWPNYDYTEGYKETDMGIGGRWSLNGNTITITITSRMGEALEEDEYKTSNIQLTVITRNNIILTFSNGKQIKLTRSNDMW